MNYLSNSFSLQQLVGCGHIIEIECVTKEELIQQLKDEPFISAIGHKTTARVLTKELDTVVPYNRIGIKLSVGDNLYVAQYSGGRMEENEYKLPEGASFRYYHIIKWDDSNE